MIAPREQDIERLRPIAFVAHPTHEDAAAVEPLARVGGPDGPVATIETTGRGFDVDRVRGDDLRRRSGHSRRVEELVGLRLVLECYPLPAARPERRAIAEGAHVEEGRGDEDRFAVGIEGFDRSDNGRRRVGEEALLVAEFLDGVRGHGELVDEQLGLRVADPVPCPDAMTRMRSTPIILSCATRAVAPAAGPPARMTGREPKTSRSCACTSSASATIEQA